jgi:hypothetical protein
MNFKNADEATILHTVGNATLFLADLSNKGCIDISSDDAEKLLQFSEAFRVWKLIRLSELFDRLNKELVSVNESSEEGDTTSIASIISDAIFTCKAIKTCYKGRLEDVRVQTSLIGRDYKNSESDKIENVTVIKIGEEICAVSRKHQRLDEYYMEFEGRGAIYKKETRIEPLAVPVKPTLPPNVTQAIMVERATLTQDFPPRKIQIKKQSIFPAHPEIIPSIIEQATADYSLITTIYKAFRSNLFAPEDFYTLLKFHGIYSSSSDLYLIDEKENMLKVSDDWNGGTQTPFLERAIYEPIDAVFGKVSVRGQDLIFAPLSTINRKATSQISFLSRCLGIQPTE